MKSMRDTRVRTPLPYLGDLPLWIEAHTLAGMFKRTHTPHPPPPPPNVFLPTSLTPGNAGPTLKHTYFKAVAVFFPRAHVPHLLKKGSLAPLGQAAERVAGYIPQGWASLRSKSYLGVMRSMMASNALAGVPTTVLGLLSRAVQAAPSVPHVKAAANAAVRGWLKGQAGASSSSSSSSSSSMYSYGQRLSMHPRATSSAVKTVGFLEFQALLAVLPPLETELLAKPLGECLTTPSGVSVRYPEQACSLVSRCITPNVLAHLHLRLLEGLLSGVPLTKDPWAPSSYTRSQTPTDVTVGDACTAACAALLWPAPEAPWKLPEDLHPTYMGKLRAALRDAGPTIAGARLRATLALPRVAAALGAGDEHATSLRTLLSDLRAARMAELAPDNPLDAFKALEEEVSLAKNDMGSGSSGSGSGSGSGEPLPAQVGGEEESLRALLVRALLSASLPPSPKSPPWLLNDAVVAEPPPPRGYGPPPPKPSGYKTTPPPSHSCIMVKALVKFLWEPNRAPSVLPVEELSAHRSRLCALLVGRGGGSPPLTAALGMPLLRAEVGREAGVSLLVRARISHLEQECGARGGPPVAPDWSWPILSDATSLWPSLAHCSLSPACLAILRSKEQSGTLRGFSGLPGTRSVVRDLGRWGNALRTEVGGRGKDAYVRLFKSTELGQRALAQAVARHGEAVRERRELCNLLGGSTE
jgi:hypothetical protein